MYNFLKEIVKIIVIKYLSSVNKIHGFDLFANSEVSSKPNEVRNFVEYKCLCRKLRHTHLTNY